MKTLITGQYRLHLLAAAVITLFYNQIFFSQLTKAFPFTAENVLFLGAVGIFLFLLHCLLFAIIGGKYVTKPFLILFFMLAPACGYFMAEYGVVIDRSMLQNVAETDTAEAMGLLNVSLILRVLLLGVVPAILIWRWRVEYHSFKKELVSKLLVIVMVLIAMVAVILPFGGNFASLFREYKPVRYYINPGYAVYSATRFVIDPLRTQSHPETPAEVSTDAHMVHGDDDAALGRPSSELMILVVGESARADHFQLNGYLRETNPYLSTIPNLVSFTNVHSCGTTTATSVPCMFSIFTRAQFEKDAIYTHENALNVLKRDGVNILWRDNNSSSKGVADRLQYENYHHADVNTVCDDECRDEGMLVGLQEYVDAHAGQDILIVLHSFGSHGPEYYKRYPASAEYFTPTCKTNKLGECPEKEIVNAYDNTIRYTDHFLSKIIGFLKKNDDKFETGMFYMSDHGESLGEGGIYLHGMPYALAPEAQTHVASIIWTGKHFDMQARRLLKNKDKPYTHDNFYCTLLSMFEIFTDDCPIGSGMLDIH